MGRQTATALFRFVAAAVMLLLPSVAMSADPLNLGTSSYFAILGLNGGSVIINSGRTLAGNVGYCAGVVSHTNQKVDTFIGGVYVHSTADFNYTPATFAPSDGFHFGSTNPGVDSQLNQAYLDALAASAAATALTPTQVLGVLGDGDSRVINSTGPVNVISITSLNYNSDHMDFVSRPGFTDYFIVNVYGNFYFSQSVINTIGTDWMHILWNFPGPASIDLNKASNEFSGTILAPLGNVTYHNPATFYGRIIAPYIYLHSDFNLETPTSVKFPTWGGVKTLYR